MKRDADGNYIVFKESEFDDIIQQKFNEMEFEPEDPEDLKEFQELMASSVIETRSPFRARVVAMYAVTYPPPWNQTLDSYDPDQKDHQHREVIREQIRKKLGKYGRQIRGLPKPNACSHIVDRLFDYLQNKTVGNPEFEGLIYERTVITNYRNPVRH